MITCAFSYIVAPTDPPDGRPVQEGGEPVYLDNRGDPADTEGDLQEVTALR